MGNMKEWVAGVFDIDTHEDTVMQLQLQNESLADRVAKLQVANENLIKRNQFLEMSEKDKLEVMSESLDGLRKQYEVCISEYMDMTAKANKVIEEAEQKIHGAFANGRMAAYSEMGIRNIEAHEKGNELAILEDGSIVELITNLEDVYKETTTEDEIFIDDLIEV